MITSGAQLLDTPFDLDKFKPRHLVDVRRDIEAMKYKDEWFFSSFYRLMMLVLAKPKQKNESDLAKFIESGKCRLLIRDQYKKPRRGKIKYDNGAHDAVRSLQLKCFSPNVCLDFIREKEPLSIILLSGTLAPMSFIESELGMPFAIKEECSHVINEKQIMVSAARSFNGKAERFNFTKNKRCTNEMMFRLGSFIRAVSYSMKDVGILIFYASYDMMNVHLRYFKKHRIVFN